MIQDFERIERERNRIKVELDLENKVRKGMLDLFDCVVGSFTSDYDMLDIARTVAFTASSTKSLDATRAISKGLFTDEKNHTKKYHEMILTFVHTKKFQNPEPTIKLAETFVRYQSLDKIHEGWYNVMKLAYIYESDIEESVMTQIDLNSQFSMTEQENVIKFITNLAPKNHNKEALKSVFRTLEAYHQNKLFPDIINTLKIMIPWHDSFNMMKDAADILYRYRKSPYLRNIAEVIREGNDQSYLRILKNGLDIHNLNKENLMCYLNDIKPHFKVGELSNNLPLRTINNLAVAYSLVVAHFDNCDDLLKFDAGDVFYKVLNKKVELGETDQEKIQILDEWSTNVYRMVRDNPESLNYMRDAA